MLSRCASPVRLALRTQRLTGIATRVRLFHLAGQDSVDFLKEHITGLKVDQTDAQPTDSIKVLLHADRRPKVLSSGVMHYGPALLACSSASLHDQHTATLGTGELGILSLQQRSPDRVVDLPLPVEQGLQMVNSLEFVRKVTTLAGLSASHAIEKQAAETLHELWQVFEKCEGTWFTFGLNINGSVSLNAPFLDFDDFAIHRIPALQHLYAKRERQENAAKAEDGGLFYIKLPTRGSVGSFGYGAGNAMATMDGVALLGGQPANFLDGGGGANKANAKLAIETLDRDPDVRSIFVNTFGGITQTDVVAQGIIEAVQENHIDKPITVRVLGTGAERAKELLQESNLGFTIEDDFKRAAQAAVQRAM